MVKLLELEKKLLFLNFWVFARCRKKSVIQRKKNNQHLLIYFSVVVFFSLNSSVPVWGFVGYV